VRNFLRSFVFAAQGISHVVRTQRNARVHLVISLIVVIAAVYFGVSNIEWAILFLSMGVVLGAEMFNTVAELAVDLLVQRYHPLAKIAKDAGAGAVLLAALAAVGVGASIFGPRLWALAFGW
jgi:diacylglycerol kinase